MASGLDRSRIAAEEAVASPLLDDISLDGARGVLVNISTAPGCLLLREYHEIMEIIRNYAHADAEVKFGTAEVDGMSEDEIRVTLIATGLGGGKKPAREERREQLKVVKNGTDGTTMEVPDFQQPDFDKPSVFRARSGRGAPQQVDFLIPRWAIRSIFRLSCAARLD